MKYILEEARKGGWAVFKQNDFCAPDELVATGNTMDEAFAHISTSRPSPHSLDEWARMVVDCNSADFTAPKIKMIKLLRNITACSLKEGKEAIERCL